MVLFHRLNEKFFIIFFLGTVLCLSVMTPEIFAAEPRKSALEQELEEARNAARVAGQREAALRQKLGEMKQETKVEVYVVYSGKNYSEKEEFLDKLADEVSAKSFNVDRLGIEDYTERQKASARFQRVPMVIFLLDEPMKIFRGLRLSRDLLVVQSVMKTVKSDARTIYVLNKGRDFSHLGKNLRSLKVSDPANLREIEALDGVGVVLVEGENLNVIHAASLVASTILAEGLKE